MFSYTKCRALINAYCHICTLAPDCEAIKEHFVFVLLACDDGSIVRKLEPMDGVNGIPCPVNRIEEGQGQMLGMRFCLFSNYGGLKTYGPEIRFLM